MNVTISINHLSVTLNLRIHKVTASFNKNQQFIDAHFEKSPLSKYRIPYSKWSDRINLA